MQLEISVVIFTYISKKVWNFILLSLPLQRHNKTGGFVSFPPFWKLHNFVDLAATINAVFCFSFQWFNQNNIYSGFERINPSAIILKFPPANSPS